MVALLAVMPLKVALAGSCAEEAARAERDWNLPPGLLAAIGVVESGRVEKGHLAAWPFSLNAGGVGHQYGTAADAIAQVGAWQADGIRSIDVGCFQVNLMYHPNAFHSLEEAFDPAANAREAAHFLHDLYAATGDWEAAAARYHSSNPPIGQPYARTVMAAWGVPATPAAPPAAEKPSVLQKALDNAGIHLPATVIHQQPATPPQPAQRPTRLTLAGRAQRG